MWKNQPTLEPLFKMGKWGIRHCFGYLTLISWSILSLWPAKIALWAIPLIGCFLIEPSYFYPYWIPSLIGSIFFIFIQGFIFVDFSWAIAESLTEKYRARQTRWYIKWRILMAVGTVICYLLIAAGSAYLYYEYAVGDNLFGCGLNSKIFFI